MDILRTVYRWILAPLGLFYLCIAAYTYIVAEQSYSSFMEAYDEYIALVQEGEAVTAGEVREALKNEREFCLTWTEENHESALNEYASMQKVIRLAIAAREHELVSANSDDLRLAIIDAATIDVRQLQVLYEAILPIAGSHVGEEFCIPIGPVGQPT